MTDSPKDHTRSLPKVFDNGMRFRTLPILVFCAATILPFVFFLFSLAPSITFGRSGELVTQVYRLQSAFAPGFPLYSILAHIFAWLPLGEYAFRGNIFSALCAAVTSGILSLVVLKVSRRWWLALVLPLLFVLTPIVRQQATEASPFPVLWLFLAATLLCAVQWLSSKKRKYFFFAALFLGFATAVHIEALFMLPALTVLVISQRKETPLELRTVLIGSVLFLAALFIPVFSVPMQANFGNVVWPIFHVRETLHNIFVIDSGTSVVSTLGYPASTQFVWHDIAQFASSFISMLFDVFGTMLFFCALLGIVVLFLRRSFFGLVCFLIVVFSFLGIVVLMHVPFAVLDPQVFQVLMVQALVPVFVLATLGIEAALDWASKKNARRFFVPALVVIVLAVILDSLAQQSFAALHDERRDDETLLRTYTQSILAQVPRNTVLVYRDSGELVDSFTSAFLYAQIVEHQRPDVTVVHPAPYPAVGDFLNNDIGTTVYTNRTLGDKEFLKSVLASTSLGQRPLFALEPFAQTNLVVPRSTGLVYQLFPIQKTPSVPESSATTFRDLAVPALRPPLTLESHVLALYYYARSFFFAQRHDLKQSGRSLVQAITDDPAPLSIDYYKFITARGTLGLEKEQGKP